MEMYIVLAVTLLMMISFILHKVSPGVTIMAYCLTLAVTGIMGVQSAFSSFESKIVVLITPILALSSVLTEASLIVRISSAMNTTKGKRGMPLVASFFLISAIFTQLVPTIAAITILMVFSSTLDNTGDITIKQVLLPLLGVTVVWKFRLPTGSGTLTFATVNGMYGGIISNPEFQLTMLDLSIFSIPVMILPALYCFFFWELMPRSEEDIGQSKLKETKKMEMLSHGREVLVYAVFTVVMLLVMLNKWTDNMLYPTPELDVLILTYAKILRVDKTAEDTTSSMVWMIAGVLVAVGALEKSGAGSAVGNLIPRVLGSNPSSLTVMLIFSAAIVIMTIFLSNMATQTVLIPVAASVALVGGWDPRRIVLIIGICNYSALRFPSDSGEAAVCFAVGGYNSTKVLRFIFPFVIMAILTCAFMADIMYPIY